MTENTENIKSVSYKKCLPTFEGTPDDSLSYIDLQYNPQAFKLPHSSSQSKFNSLPNIKNRRRSNYISSLEGILYPKSDTLDNLTMDVKAEDTDTECKPIESNKDEDTESKTSESTTVVISTSDSVCSDSPRGVTNEAFEDDEEVDSSCKKGHRRSPSGSLDKDEKTCDVSYSSNGSTIEIPIELTKDGMKKAEMAQDYQYIVPESKLRKGWRGETLYFTKGNPDNRADRHFRRFCWWMVCLVLLAGAITVAALIGVGVIKLPLDTQNERIPDYNSGELNGPRLGQVRNQDAPQETTTKSLIEMISPPRMKDDKVLVPYVPEDTNLPNMNTVWTAQPAITTSTEQASTKIITTTEKIETTSERADSIVISTTAETIQTTMPKQLSREQNMLPTREPEQIRKTTAQASPTQTIAPVSITTTQFKQTMDEDQSTETPYIQTNIQFSKTTEIPETTTVPEELHTEPSIVISVPASKKSIVVIPEDFEGSTEELIEGSGSSETIIEDFGSGIEINFDEMEVPKEDFSSAEDEPKTISVEELFKEEFATSGDFQADTNVEQLEVNTEFVMTRDSPRDFPENKEEGEMELVITLPEMLSGSFLDIMSNDNQENLENGSGDNSFELNQLPESVKNFDDVSEPFDNGEDVFKALLDLILPKLPQKEEENTITEDSDLSLGELIKHIGSQ